MTPLQKSALGRLPLSAMEVETIHRLRVGDNSDLSRQLRKLCESHERLRMELEGSAVLHEESAKALRDAADQAAKIRGGLLRIFARAPDWSGECVQANAADLLGMTVRQVQAEINDLPEEGAL